jgi:uncharacterized protein
MSSEVSHIEIGTTDSATTGSFFSKLFGWDFQGMGPDGGLLRAPTCPVGVHPQDPSLQLVVYFRVADIESAVLQVRSFGGTAGAISPEEPGFGRFVTCKDPNGVAFGLHQQSA